MTTTPTTDTRVRANPARDTWNVLTRELKPVVRDPFTLIFSLVQPLVFLGLALFLFLRSDPEVWPLGEIGFFGSLRDVEVLQHRVFVLLLVGFAFFEWGVRTGRLRRPGAALVFPLLTALGGALLLTHSHAIANVRDQLLIEITHTPLALAGIGAGWARWLELRLDGRASRIAGWAWPVCFLIVGAVLLIYREA